MADSSNESGISEVSSYIESDPDSIDQDVILSNKGDKKFSFKDLPKSVKYILGTEASERFGFYGIKAILPLFTNTILGYSEDDATASVHLFVGLVYIFPVVGAWLGDAKLGRYRTILYLAILYSFGGFLLSISAGTDVLFSFNDSATISILMWVSLFILAVASGGIKPNVTSMAADQLPASKQYMIPSLYALFYFAINSGSVFSTIFTPMIRTAFSYSVAFAVPATLILVATVVFWSGRNLYIKNPPTSSVIVEFIEICKEGWKKSKKSSYIGSIDTIDDEDEPQLDHFPNDSETESAPLPLPKNKKKKWIHYAIPRYGELRVSEAESVLNVLKIFIPLPFFWMLWDQHSSRFVFQARRMDRHFGSIELDPDQLPAINPIMVLILIPLYEKFLYPSLKKCGVPMKPLSIMAYGMIQISISFIIAGLFDLYMETGGTLHVTWQLITYFLLTSGEVFTSITLLSFSYSQTSVRLKSVVLACAQLTTSVGNFITLAIVEAHFFNEQSKEFFLFAAIMVVFSIVFLFTTRSYKYVDSVYGDGSVLKLGTAESRSAESRATSSLAVSADENAPILAAGNSTRF